MNYLKTILIFIFCLGFCVAQAQTHPINSKNSYVKITTNLGEMVFELSEKTPMHTANFIQLAKKGYFNTYDFNRVIKGFVVQGGETDSAYAAMEKRGIKLERIAPEFSGGLFHQRGALAAGRDDNPTEASFLGQFYIVDGKKYTDLQLNQFEKRIGNNFHFSDAARKNYIEVGGTPSLDQHYTVFGQLVSGWEVLDRITNVGKDKSDRPFVQITMKIEVLSKKAVRQLFSAKSKN